MVITQVHPIPPLYDRNSTILILGSFPSVKSREQGFFYGHPQNRFWKVIAGVFNEPIPSTLTEKKLLLYKNNIALWDVIAACDIAGSSDSSIKNVVVNEFSVILNNCDIKQIFLNGKTAERLFKKYASPIIPKLNPIGLPSTSPANAAYSFEKLLSEWKLKIQRNTPIKNT